MDPTKRQPDQHIMERESFRLLADVLPREWVIHDYSPDYGIDKVIEVFEPTSTDASVSQTLGELLFIQVKALQRATTIMVRAYQRLNVAKYPFNSERKGEPVEIEVISFSVETSLLHTVSAMGPAVPVMLLIASLDDRKLYFICLNDAIDKVVIPEHPRYRKQETVTLHIPTRNVLDGSNGYGLHALRLYAKRSKLYAAFNLFAYQYNELLYGPDPALVPHFCSQAMRFDFWSRTEDWGMIPEGHKRLEWVSEMITADEWWVEEDNLRGVMETWHWLANMGRVFEEITRDAFLATQLGQLL